MPACYRLPVAGARFPSRLAWAAWMLLALGCRDETPGPSLPPAQTYVLELEVPDGVRSGRGRAEWVRDLVAQGVAETRWLRVEGEGEHLEAALSYREHKLEPGLPVLWVRIAVEPDAELREALGGVGEELEAHVELERRDRTVELERDLPFAVKRALAILDAKITTARGDVADLQALLADEDPEVILVALGGIQRRSERSLGDAVYGLLGHDDERVALRAVECLGVIGGPEHAPGLLRGARLADRAHANRLYEALANLGGEDARGFLEFAARNEEDPELASLAEQALTRLDAKEPHAASGEGTEAVVVTRGHRQ